MIRAVGTTARAVSPRRALSTFQSKHNSIGIDEVRAYLQQIPGLEMNETRAQFNIKDCSVMPKGVCLNPTGTDKSSNQVCVSPETTSA
jgi:type II secretory pathway component HofQ